MQRCFQFNGGNKMPRNLLFIECSYLKEPGNQVGRQKLLTATMAGCPNGWPGLQISGVSRRFSRSLSCCFAQKVQLREREKSISCLVLQGKISRGGGGGGGVEAELQIFTTRSPSCTGLTKYRCKIRDSIHQEKPEKSWRFCCFDSGKSD
uniref:Uncharacterized protein n=1 Tax=Salix viminalis TaxID=40686 RepID=A0A6N2N276_SALVM